MHRGSLLIVLVLIVLSVFLLFSCDNEIEAPVISFSTPSIIGRVSLPEGSGLSPNDIWIKIIEEETTKYVGKAGSDGSFAVSGLDASKKYDVLFTSIEPEQQNVSREFKSRAASTTNGFGGWLSDVSASIDDANIGSVKIKPLGTINGKAIRSGAVDNYDVMVYIPGTSFMAMTNEDGSFSITNVPQGTHRLRYTSDDYMSQMKENVLLFSDDDTVNPVTTVPDVTLIKNAGILKGYATLHGAASNAGIIIKLEGDNATGSEIGTTASDGSFSIPDVKPGTYSALFSYAGYIDRKVENLVIEAAKTTTMPSSVSLIANGGTITGTVRQNDSLAGTGASVLAEVTIGEADFTYSSTVDADGKFTLNDCRPADGYSITVSKTGFASVVRSGISLTVEGIDLPEIMLSSEFGGISGYVKDSKMNAINGAQVNIGDYTAFTNSEGYFIKSDLPLGQYTVTVSKDGYTTKTLAQKVSIESNKTATIGEQMLTSMYGSINGTIALNDGKSPEGATVTAASADGRNRYPATAASDGTYSISNVLPATYTLSVIKEGYEAGSKTISVTADYTTAAGTITLESLYGSLKVLVNYADKDPDDKITVSIRNGESSIRTATTSNSSTLIFDDIPVGAGYVVVASALGYSSSEKTSVSVISNTETTVQLDDLSNRYGSVSGTVQMSSGSPLSGALVLLKGTSEYTATTDENGAFAKDGIGIGSYEVTISKDGYGTLKLATAVSVESSKVTSIGTQRLASVHGAIGGTARLQGAGDHTGILVTASGARSYTASTGADGSYSIAGMEPGSYAVAFTKAGYVNQTANVAVEADKASLVPEAILISSSCAIAGSVVLEGSPSNSGVTVSATLVGDPSKVSTVTTLEDGTYYIGGLDAGQYAIQIQMNGYVTDRSKLVHTTYGETTVIGTVVLKSVKATVRGSVTLIGTNINTGISVMLKTQDNRLQYDATTAQDGAFVLTGVQPGVYSLYVSKAGYESKAINDITIEPTSVKIIDSISLAVAQRSIYGNVQLELRTDHAGALVTATKTSDPDKVYSAISNSAGDYSLAGMEPGEYRIVITSSGYRTLTLPTTDVIASSTANLETVDLIIARGTISGIVTLKGRSSQEGTQVELLGTGYETLTNELGEYSFSVPQGNYPGGIRFTKTDFKAGSYAETIPVLTDSTFAVPTRELEATHVPIYGSVDVQGTDDDSAVTISFENGTHSEVLTTDEAGSFRFDHVVLGSHTIRFSRDNAPDITVQVEARASDGINVGTVRLTPNSASIHGIVRLKDATSYSGVKVEVEVQDKGRISTVTGVGGDYYIGGIYSVGTHTVTFSKDGWNLQATTVSDLAPLEDREMSEMTLIDTTPPLLKSLTINSGANTAANKLVTLHVDATELGSGISKMQISNDNVFDQTVTMRDYSPSFGWELPSGNGLKTIYMKLYDASGNASNVASASVTLTDQKKEVWGVLTGEDLNWTKEKSPYLVTGNILVERNKTLTIDPGVDVQFPGAYFLRIEGTLRAIGTEEEKISFYGIDNAEWDGINGSAGAEARLSHVAITHLRDGIWGYVDIDHSEISSASGYALGTAISNDRAFRGTARENKIVGKIRTYEASLFRNVIQDDGAGFVNSFLSGNEFSGGSTEILINNSFAENNKFEGKTMTLSSSGMTNSTFTNCSLSINSGGLYNKNSYSDCNFNNFIPAKVINSNLINCGLITVTALRSDYEEIDMTGNFWGYDKTREITEKGISSNLSFIHDYYDDFNKTKVVYSSYRNEPLSGVGYMGDSYYPVVAESPIVYGIGDTGPAGGIVFHDKGFYSEGWRYLEAAPSDLDGSIIFGFYKATANSNPQSSGTSTGIGLGRTNTQMLVDTMGDQAYSSYIPGDGSREAEYAAKLCENYESNGHSDWFLPSKDELDLMYKYLKVQGLGGFSGGNYWSSSESCANYAWNQYFNLGNQNYYDRYLEHRVRPVRAF